MSGRLLERSELAQMISALAIQTHETIESSQGVIEKMRVVAEMGVEFFALVTITLCFESEGKVSAPRQSLLNSSRLYFFEHLCTLVRRTDIVLLQGYTMHFLLLQSELAGGEIVQARLWDALLWQIHSLTELEVLRPSGLVAGYGAYPAPSGTYTECLQAACQPQRHFELQQLEKTTRKMVLRQPATPQTQEVELPQLARQMGVPYLSLLPRTPPEHVQQIVTPKLAHELRCYPLGRNKDVLTVALVNPQDRSVLDRLEEETGLHIFPVLTPVSELQTALDQFN